MEVDFPQDINIPKMKTKFYEKYGNDIQFTIEKETIIESQQEWSWRTDSSYTSTKTFTKTWLICEK